KLGPLIAKRRTPKIAERYQQIGGGSPIRSWTDKQGLLLTNLLDKISPKTAPHKHYIGFRYAHPLTENTLDEIEREGPMRMVAFSQYPQYSCSTSGSSLNAMYRYYHSKNFLSKVKWSFIDRWPMNLGLVEVFSQLICTELEKFPKDARENVVLLFSAHSSPMKAVNRGDTYSIEVASTVLRVMERLEWKYPYRLVWQSKVGPIPWLGPQTDVAMKAFVSKGYKSFLVIPISFVNEHIETLHELDIEYGQELGKEIGVEHFRRVPTPNDHPIFIKALAELVKNHLEVGEIYSPQLLLRCPLCENPVCHDMRKWLKSLNL
ncbi:ferrochelatase, mitochondrial-like, partial [Centruroides sculpturatus]|uniref:ferrochelatase, mitochondrial-like n=1 Tax=Centruroides sculpturatus TaxID=218467 RepID=UPI000C6D3668